MIVPVLRRDLECCLNLTRVAANEDWWFQWSQELA